MGNLLSVPTSWVDGNGATPPQVWTGTLYDFTGSDGNVCSIDATANAGNVVGFTLNNLAVSNSPRGFQVFVNGVSVYQNHLDTVGTATWQSATLNSGDAIELSADVEFVDFYTVDFTITPSTPPAPPIPGPGFILATGDTLSPSSGPGSLVTALLPALTTIQGSAPSYVRAPWGMAVVFYGGSPVYSLPLPEDVGLPAYEGAPKQKFTWKSKKFVFPGQTTFAAAKVVHSCMGGGVRFRLYIDCCCVFETVVRGCVPFRLPANLRGITCEIELSGCSRVTEVRVASSIRELMGDE